jgi:cation:H+ antiporter
VTAGDVAVGPVGLWSTFLIVAYLGGVALLARYEKGPETWTAQEGPLPDPADAQDTPQDNRSLPWLVASTAVAAAFILVAGWALSQSGAAAAAQTGLGSAFFGATILAVATSLPEISTVFAAVRLRRYEMALGDIFGTNLFNAALIFVIDLLAPGDPVLGRVGAFSAFGALLGLVLTAIFMAGVIERRDRTVLRMGWDSLAALVVYAAGVAVLFALRGQTDGG